MQAEDKLQDNFSAVIFGGNSGGHGQKATFAHPTKHMQPNSARQIPLKPYPERLTRLMGNDKAQRAHHVRKVGTLRFAHPTFCKFFFDN